MKFDIKKTNCVSIFGVNFNILLRSIVSWCKWKFNLWTLDTDRFFYQPWILWFNVAHSTLNRRYVLFLVRVHSFAYPLLYHQIEARERKKNGMTFECLCRALKMVYNRITCTTLLWIYWMLSRVYNLQLTTTTTQCQIPFLFGQKIEKQTATA